MIAYFSSFLGSHIELIKSIIRSQTRGLDAISRDVRMWTALRGYSTGSVGYIQYTGYVM